ncbi:MAG TPA: hypothetical protein DIU45_14955 [Clostridium sp.]|nr:hypothetical protein [Clostridium sp.]
MDSMKWTVKKDCFFIGYFIVKLNLKKGVEFMSKKTFSDIEIKKLSKNKYVKSVSERGITYTDDFKVHFISENKLGKSPSEIFSEAGFDIDIIGENRIYNAGKR